jgi:hypothetical protein
VQLLQRHDANDVADIREPVAALSGISLAARIAVLSLQRQAPVFPPVISAEVLQKCQRGRI